MSRIRKLYARTAVARAILTPIGVGATILFMIAACAQSPPESKSESKADAAPLGGSSWQLVQFQGGDGTVLKPDDKSTYTMSFAANGTVSIRVDCNRGSGTWKSSAPNQLEFGPLALTRAMCAPSPLYDRVVNHWPYIRSYVRKGGHVFLSLQADAGIYEFEPLGS